MNAAQFNARHPVGTLVFAYPGCRPEHGSGTRLVTRTRTEAQLSASGHPVVWVEGEGAYIALTHVDPVSEDVWEAAREAEKPAEPETVPDPARLTPQREAEIRSLVARTTPLGAVTASPGALAALLAELAAVRAERDQARERLDEMTHLRDNALRALYRDDVEVDIDLEETIAAPFYGPGWDWDEADLLPVVREAAAAVRPAFAKLTQQRDQAQARAAAETGGVQ